MTVPYDFGQFVDQLRADVDKLLAATVPAPVTTLLAGFVDVTSDFKNRVTKGAVVFPTPFGADPSVVCTFSGWLKSQNPALNPSRTAVDCAVTIANVTRQGFIYSFLPMSQFPQEMAGESLELRIYWQAAT